MTGIFKNCTSLKLNNLMFIVPGNLISSRRKLNFQAMKGWQHSILYFFIWLFKPDFDTIYRVKEIFS